MKRFPLQLRQNIILPSLRIEHKLHVFLVKLLGDMGQEAQGVIGVGQEDASFLVAALVEVEEREISRKLHLLLGLIEIARHVGHRLKMNGQTEHMLKEISLFQLEVDECVAVVTGILVGEDRREHIKLSLHHLKEFCRNIGQGHVAAGLSFQNITLYAGGEKTVAQAGRKEQAVEALGFSGIIHR